jgi:hypothetical protein
MNGGMGKSYYSTICQENLKYNFLMLYLGNAMYCMSGNLKHQIKTVGVSPRGGPYTTPLMDLRTQTEQPSKLLLEFKFQIPLEYLGSCRDNLREGKTERVISNGRAASPRIQISNPVTNLYILRPRSPQSLLPITEPNQIRGEEETKRRRRGNDGASKPRRWTSTRSPAGICRRCASATACAPT